MKRLLVLAGLCAVVLGGCGQPQSQGGDSAGASSIVVTTTSTAKPATATTAPPTVNRGPIAKKIGDKAGLDCTGTTVESCAVQYVITKLTDCTGEYAGDPPPEGTRRQLVWIEVSTGAAYDRVRHYSGQITQFQAIDSRGVTTGGDLNPSSSWTCVPKQERMGFGDESWVPNRKYAGAVEIYLPEDAVKIVNGKGMWEWSLA